jgi:hypothetical protein
VLFQRLSEELDQWLELLLLALDGRLFLVCAEINRTRPQT